MKHVRKYCRSRFRKKKYCWKADKKEKPAVAKALAGEVGKTRFEISYKILLTSDLHKFRH